MSDIYRFNRKIEHIEKALECYGENRGNGLEDVVLIHQALPKYDLKDIDISTNFLDKKLEAPLYINAITGGHNAVKKINETLAYAAKETGIAIMVGSEKAAIQEPLVEDTYKIVRDINKDGLVIGNLSANSKIDEVRRAIEIIEADAIQLHLNVAQELFMTEGERNFKTMKYNIANIVDRIDIPIIVKEVGFGIGSEVIEDLMEIGVQYIDISGSGGTNFIEIEMARSSKYLDRSLIDWGIPTAHAMIEALNKDVKYLMASGGIKNSLECAKCLALGADMVGFSGILLRLYHEKIDMVSWLQEIKENLRKTMLLTNSQNLDALKNCPKVVTGGLKEWCDIRKLNCNKENKNEVITCKRNT